LEEFYTYYTFWGKKKKSDGFCVNFLNREQYFDTYMKSHVSVC